MAYLGCAAALGYGVLKVIWALVGMAGLILTIRYFAGDLGNDRLGGIWP